MNQSNSNDNKSNELKNIAHFLFEGSMLKRVMRTGYPFLGRGEESTAAHSFGACIIAFVLARMTPGVNLEKLLKICLFHDLPEARTGDTNAVHKRYVHVNEKLAVENMIKNLPFNNELHEIFEDYSNLQSIESILAHDADKLDILIALKEQGDIGCNDALIWLPYVKNRLKSEQALKLADAILNTRWADWWMKEIIEGYEG